MFPKLEGQFALVVQAIMFTKSGGSVSFPGSDYVLCDFDAVTTSNANIRLIMA